MKTLAKVLIIAAIGFLLCLAWNPFYIREHLGISTVRIFNYGHCPAAFDLDSRYLKQHHYEWGKLYPVALTSGRIDTGADFGTHEHWMCRFHAAQWLGKDPEGQLQFVMGELR